MRVVLFNFLLAPCKHIYAIELFNPTPPLDFPNETGPNGHFNIYILIIYSANKKSRFVGFARLCVLQSFLSRMIVYEKSTFFSDSVLIAIPKCNHNRFFFPARFGSLELKQEKVKWLFIKWRIFFQKNSVPPAQI